MTTEATRERTQKAQPERTHAEELSNGIVKLQKGIDTMVRKEHIWPECDRKDGD